MLKKNAILYLIFQNFVSASTTVSGHLFYQLQKCIYGCIVRYQHYEFKKVKRTKSKTSGHNV